MVQIFVCETEASCIADGYKCNANPNDCCSGVPCPDTGPTRRRKCLAPDLPRCTDAEPPLAELIPLDFAGIEIPVNNLGGFCGNGATEGGLVDCKGVADHVIEFKDVGVVDGQPISLVVRNTGPYIPVAGRDCGGANCDGHYNNGALGSMGQINVKHGTSVDLEFEFQRNGSPIAVSGYFLFFDIDANCECDPRPDDDQCANCDACANHHRDVFSFPSAQIEVPSFGTFGDQILSPNTNICVNNAGGVRSFWATSNGDGVDNPESFGMNANGVLTGLGNAARDVAGGFAFTGRSVLSATYEVKGPQSENGRNLVFSAVLYTECIGGEPPVCEGGQENLLLIPFEFEGDSVEIPLNNLGGYCGNGATTGAGECGSDQEKEIIFKNVGLFDNQAVTLVVKNTSLYQPSVTNTVNDGGNDDGHFNNGALGNVGQVNVKQGTSVDLEFVFVIGDYPNGGYDLVNVTGFFVLFDIDTQDCECDPKPGDGDCDICDECDNKPRDIYTVSNSQINNPNYDPPNDFDNIIRDSSTTVCIIPGTDETSFWATSEGNGLDNPDTFGFTPSGFSGLSNRQKKVAAAFSFVDESSLHANYQVSGPVGNKGRNIVFSVALWNCKPVVE